MNSINLIWRLDRAEYVIARLDLAIVDHTLRNERPRCDEILTHEGLDAICSLTCGPIGVERDHGDILCARITDDFVQTRVGDRYRDPSDIARNGCVHLIDNRRVIVITILDLKLEASHSGGGLRSVDGRHKEKVAGTALNLEQDRASANVSTSAEAGAARPGSIGATTAAGR